MNSREDILLEYLDRLAYEPYPVQEEALFAWAACDQGILLSAPTGTGKTLVAEGAVYEALRTDKFIYYSTPLIALTDQKFLELQDTVEKWGFDRDRVGLVTGHRTVNPNAQVKVVVAEVLLNRLLHPEAFDFSGVSAVVMDEFHSFNEPQRGIVWELSLFLLPAHVRVMLLSATVGSANEFISWMARSLNRRVTLVEGTERKVPLSFQWVGDELLPDFLESVAGGSDETRKTPALVFCFDRELCWSTAELLKGKDLFREGQRDALMKRLDEIDFSIGVGNKLRTILARGVGVHHAGLLPRYRRVVEELFQEKLLSVCVCTETLAAGLNLPARSVVLTSLVKGPRDKKKLIETGSAQQMFGRAGRPQFDDKGFVFAMSHEDDVKIARWQEKYDSIPADTKDPKLMTAKKKLLKKKPTRRQGFTYWNPEQFEKLQNTAAAKLASKGNLNWRWLGFLLDASPEIEPIRKVIRHRLMDPPTIEAQQRRLTRMLVTLHELGVVVLDPPPPASWLDAVKPLKLARDGSVIDEGDEDESDDSSAAEDANSQTDFSNEQDVNKLLGQLKLGDLGPAASQAKEAAKPTEKVVGSSKHTDKGNAKTSGDDRSGDETYEPVTATPTSKLKDMMVFRAVHPLYGLFLMDYLGLAENHELVQILESLLEMPGTVARHVRVPWPEDLPPGELSQTVVDPAVIGDGLATHDDLYPSGDQSDLPPELRKYPIPLGQKMRMLFESRVDHGGGLFINPVWAAGEMIATGGDFDKFVRLCELTKQEGVLFKHILRMILLCDEFAQLTPPGMAGDAWKESLRELGAKLTHACREVDPQSTDETLEEMLDG